MHCYAVAVIDLGRPPRLLQAESARLPPVQQMQFVAAALYLWNLLIFLVGVPEVWEALLQASSPQGAYTAWCLQHATQ